MDKTTIKKAISDVKQSGRAKKLAAGSSVHLYVKPNGASSWRLKYRLPLADGRRIEKLYIIGKWPEADI